MITYRTELGGIGPHDLAGFFEGWPSAPSSERRLEAVRGSSHVVLAFDGERLVGFVTAVSDGALAAFIPLLEVLGEYRGRGIGTALVRRMVDLLDGFYSVDLVCDDDLIPFYEDLGFARWTAMIRRNRDALAD